MVEVVTKVASLGGARIVLAQSVRRGGDVLVEASVTVALVDRDGRPRRFPQAVRSALSVFAAPG
ncbi:hypothetical protein D3C83_92400 [compost metagenome]